MISCKKSKNINRGVHKYEYYTTLVLDELEKDIDGIKKLTEKAYTIIEICKYQYISGNAGININEKLIKRLNNLNLGRVHTKEKRLGSR
ncbi:hypothetical protein FACS1894151_09990 [Spirochaetia bacterium]|nr:hypothetical protein FACS1894151_09990 [Spirochaetia bacterium]